MSVKLTRRGFIAGTGAAALSGVLRGPLVFAGGAPAPETVLDVRWWRGTLDGTPVKLRTYSGVRPPGSVFPGAPLIKTSPGASLRVVLDNNLSLYGSAFGAENWDGNHNVPHQLDTTNLHVHGLEVIPHLFLSPDQDDGEDLILGTSDPKAPMIPIPPPGNPKGLPSRRRYTFEIPSDQPPGFFWYHPHHHGSTVVQAVTGMAGGLIVYGDVDEALHEQIPGIKDHLVVVQDIGLFPSDTEPGVWTYEPMQNAIWDTFASNVRTNTFCDPDWQPGLNGGFTTGDYKRHFFLVNGQPVYREDHNPVKPTLPNGCQLPVPEFHMRPGEVARFRMLNGNSDLLMPIVVDGIDLHLIALDGVNFPKPRTRAQVSPDSFGNYGPDTVPQLLLAPANRAEFLIQAPQLATGQTSATYRIVSVAQGQQFVYADEKTLAHIVVSGSVKNDPNPADVVLPEPSRHYPLIKDNQITRVRDVIFSAQFQGPQNPRIGLDFSINGRLYKEDTIGDPPASDPPKPGSPPCDVKLDPTFLQEDDWTTEVGDVEEWHLSVPDNDHGGNEGHPFHIHVNSFEIYSIGGVLQEPGTIQDTVWVHKDSDVVIRTKFRQWSGKSVFHCHILPHEDTGMMKNFMIAKKS